MYSMLAPPVSTSLTPNVNPAHCSVEENRDLQQPVDMPRDDPSADEDCDMDALGGPMNINVDEEVPTSPAWDPSTATPHLHDNVNNDESPPKTNHPSTSPDPSMPTSNTTTKLHSKRKHGDLGEEGSELSEEDVSEGMQLRRSTRTIKSPNLPLDNTSRSAVPGAKNTRPSNRPKKRAHLRTVVKSEGPHAHPIFRGSTYMHLRFIDLTQIEAREISLSIRARVPHEFKLANLSYPGYHSH